uniref:RNA-directed DNA polymerase homolog n=1 Tax=Nicotiana tabacum TaxID=4097 RepID=A0A1S3ZM45_TOBAC|nr:PREDICTED: RNA-directed DNA polymerase homolog [Nicotiana tabacum]
MADLFDRLDGATMFTKIDLKIGYWKVQIEEGDEYKTTCVIRYGSYDFLVMPFGLTNAPTTFCTLMNQIFQEYIDEFVVVYFDDIVLYSQTLEEHMEHLQKEDTEDPSRSQLKIPSIRDPNSTEKRRVDVILDDRVIHA